MNELWLAVGLGVVAVAVIGLTLRKRKPTTVRTLKVDSREDRLSRALAKTVGCTPREALPSIQLELDLGASHPDETILKRAKYHYQQNLPETICNTFRDRAVG